MKYIKSFLKSQIKQAEEKYKKLKNSGRQMYELGKKEERERIVKEIEKMKVSGYGNYDLEAAHNQALQEIIRNLITNQ